MSDGPGCPHCGTIVEPTWDWCHACGFDPEGLMPPELRAAAPVPAGVVAAPSPGPAPVWEMTPMTAPAPKKGRHILATLLIIFGGIAVLAVVAFFLIGPRVARSVVSTKTGAGAGDPVRQAAPDGSFSASFSGLATASDVMSDNNVPEHELAWHGTGNIQSVRWAALAPDYTPADEQANLDYTARSIATAKGTSTSTTFQGHSARRIAITTQGRDGQVIVFIANGRFWIVQVVGPWATKEPQATDFFTSLTLVPAS